MRPREEGLRERLFEDLAEFAEGFGNSVRRHGLAAGESYLGGYVEWLGVDLVEGLLLLPREQGLALNALAEEFLRACRRYQKHPSREHLAAVEGIAKKARGRRP